ncbi:WD repeat-containing protein 89-like [Pieris napi]|uniref:WD repeat-containing protein 89-like n=1 Tax=Pieris napi TaxID=78633 RepID=UPI001FB89B99|nr:WD repeat-containing protein 89-like [Pieris napi]
MTDIIENLELDRDIIPSEEIEEQFSKKYHLLTETAVTLKTTYVDTMSVSRALKIGVSLQDNTLEVYELNSSSLQHVSRLQGHDKKITEISFHPKQESLLFSTGLDGYIRLWDLRMNGECVQEFKEDADSPIRPYECMDVSDKGNVFCTGSQLVKDECYIVFWDPRTTKPLGAYWESHTEDIIQVKFKPNTNTVLTSGATDGLINIFNLLEHEEDSALLYSLNVGNSVEKLTWLNDDQLGCVTQSDDLQIWNTATGDMIKEYSRDKVARSIKRSRDDDCYVVNMFPGPDNNNWLLAGSHGGNGNTLRSLSIADKRLLPSTDFVNNKQIVRCCHFDTHNNLLITAGESGLISVWSEEQSRERDVTHVHKNDKLHAHRHRPY